MWRISKETKQPVHRNLINLGISDYPYTVNYIIKRRLQIDSYYEMTEDKRPPRSIWDKPSELKEWFDRVYSSGEKQTEFSLPVNDNEVEE